MKVETKLKKQYESLDPEVNEYMCGLIDNLVNDYGSVQESWSLNLDMIADWYGMYVNAVKDIKTNGLTFTSAQGNLCKNPSFNVMTTASSQIQGLLRQFAATPVTKQRLKYLDQRAPIDDKKASLEYILDND